MSKVILTALAAGASLLAEYKLEPAGVPPAEVAAPVASLLQKSGHRILGPDGKAYCEIWFVSQAPSGPQSSEVDLTWKTVPHGSVLGVISFAANGADRRGQVLKPGVYTLRFSYFPLNGDHQGVAPQRDFLVLTPAADDQDAAAVSFDPLMKMSRKASGTPHPAVLSMWSVESDFMPGLSEIGEGDVVLQTKIGEKQVAVVVKGVAPA